jgi:hypothetical protein
MTIDFRSEGRLVVETAVEHLAGLFEPGAERQHLLELFARVGHLTGIDVLE